MTFIAPLRRRPDAGRSTAAQIYPNRSAAGPQKWGPLRQALQTKPNALKVWWAQ